MNPLIKLKKQDVEMNETDSIEEIPLMENTDIENTEIENTEIENTEMEEESAELLVPNTVEETQEEMMPLPEPVV